MVEFTKEESTEVVPLHQMIDVSFQFRKSVGNRKEYPAIARISITHSSSNVMQHHFHFSVNKLTF